MRLSKYTIISRIKDSDRFFIVNSLSGHADLLSGAEAEGIMKGKPFNVEELINKGYMIEDEQKERLLFRESYFDFIDRREKEDIQLFFVPTYACNFSCSYCYQDGYEPETGSLNKELIDSFFQYVNRQFGGKSKYITLFGGEPLLVGNNHRENIEYFAKRCSKHGIPLSVVTNGYYLNDYIDILKKVEIREIQVTLDGTSDAHNKRRHTRSGEPTFMRIVNGIDLLLEAGLPVNLRVVIDRENIENLPDLARFAIDKGWTSNDLFKTQIGRNYELHYCQSNNSILMSRLELYSELYLLTKDHPEILQFHRPSFSVSRFLFENGKLPDPVFDSCPGCKTEWAFDHTGHIYSCTATVGKKEEILGTFYPEVYLDEEAIEKWEDRDILNIDECHGCDVQLICGGGCGSIAKNKTGRLDSPDCRPVKGLLELGLATYIKEPSH